MEKLLSKDKYIARSDYKRAIKKYNQVVSFFDNLLASDMLKAYCQKNCLDIQRIKTAIAYYHEIEDLQRSPSFISKHNEDFLSRHLRLTPFFSTRYFTFAATVVVLPAPAPAITSV